MHTFVGQPSATCTFTARQLRTDSSDSVLISISFLSDPIAASSMTTSVSHTWVATGTCGDQIVFNSSTAGTDTAKYDKLQWFTDKKALKAWVDCPAARNDGSLPSTAAQFILDREGQKAINGRRYWCPVSPGVLHRHRLTALRTTPVTPTVLLLHLSLQDHPTTSPVMRIRSAHKSQLSRSA